MPLPAGGPLVFCGGATIPSERGTPVSEPTNGRREYGVTCSRVRIVGDLIASRGREAIAEISEKILREGYVVQNLHSKVAEVSGVETTFAPDQVAGTALATESFYDFPIFYVEYSGRYGGPEDVAAAAKHLENTVTSIGGSGFSIIPVSETLSVHDTPV
jgi:PcrB family